MITPKMPRSASTLFALFSSLLCLCCGCTEVVLVVKLSNTTSGCTNTTTTGFYRCSDFQSALQFIVDSTTDIECRVFYVQLEAGVHVIREPISTPSSVHITSSSKAEEQTIITCGYNASEVDGLHSIYFNQSNSVTITNLTIEGCPLPLRLCQVHAVKIDNSTFRYHFSVYMYTSTTCT